jgi:hypothetical protein
MRNASVFSNCREYGAESTVTYGRGPETQILPHAVEGDHVQAHVPLQVVFDKALDANEAAVGDPLRAHILKSSGNVPAGARVYGRVNRIIRYDAQIPSPKSATPRRRARSTQVPAARWGQHSGEVLVGIEFSYIEYRRSRAPFTARLIALESERKRSTPIRSFGYFEDGNLVRYDAPGTASIYVLQEDPVLRRGLVMQWLTVSH